MIYSNKKGIQDIFKISVTDSLKNAYQLVHQVQMIYHLISLFTLRMNESKKEKMNESGDPAR